MSDAYRALPAVDALLRHPALTAIDGAERERVTRAARAVIADARLSIGRGETAPTRDDLAARAAALLAVERQPHLRPVINATGVVLQTNLGRAPLAPAALAAVQETATSYSNLEYDLEAGERGSRQGAIGRLLAEVTGARAGLAVNNNAAAVLLALATHAAGREVLVSRGQLVEIGGGFRIPDVLAQSGARLVEVGTTNRTYARDYVAALTPNTAAILRVHPSNFVVRGFTHQPELAELAAAAHQHGALLIDDLGSGALLDTAPLGLAHEPMVQESLGAGADLVCFSGDKLLGGPQAGIVVGATEAVMAMARHPFARAFRIDKLGLAALEWTLRQYLLGRAAAAIPVWQMLGRPLEELDNTAAAWVEHLRAAGVPATVERGESAIGGGSLPGEMLPTCLVALTPSSVEALASRLRLGTPAVVARIHRDQLLLDSRTVLPEQEDALLARLIAAWGENGESARD